MTPIRALYIAIVAVLALGGLWDAWGGPLEETRYCTATPTRDADGSISRRDDVLRAFRDLYPCPATGEKRGACPGWNIDHVIPLAVGGCDAVSNLQWLPTAIKRCAGQACKDRWERWVYPKQMPRADPAE
ncbi:MAG: HNH endonuclease signature motif containing protein [Thiobacillus sp.]|nr:HNH endonuclease signature motif containing protein [Thiobacillus sp.]